MTDKNIGKISMQLDYVRREPDKIATVLALLRFVPVQCDYNFANNEIILTGLSDKFIEVSEGLVVPTYLISCHNNENNVVDNITVDMIC